jgi:hypothetical protein
VNAGRNMLQLNHGDVNSPPLVANLRIILILGFVFAPIVAHAEFWEGGRCDRW